MTSEEKYQLAVATLKRIATKDTAIPPKMFEYLLTLDRNSEEFFMAKANIQYFVQICSSMRIDATLALVNMKEPF